MKVAHASMQNIILDSIISFDIRLSIYIISINY